ncbi:MAG TPA: thiamine ABC transporter substrate-binding protein [Candidatus Nanopelagicaceae bacterium]
MKFSRKTLAGFALILTVGLVLLFINLSGNSKPRDVTLVTHDSFVMSKALISDFNKTTGYNLKLLKAGDAGSLTNRLILTRKTPIGDAVFGIDNTFAGVATSNDIIDGSLNPTDFGDVCFNYDKIWFAQHKIPAPISVRDLALSKYKGLTVIENPNLSSTGLSFLAASVDKFGASGWQPYWQSLKDNGIKVDNGWEAAYFTDFSGSSGKGAFPIVLSYASSPADEVRANGQSQTASLLDGCFRQTEYVGVLKNAKNPAGAAAVVKYLLSPKFQATFPDAMYMYPSVAGTPIPAAWSKFTQIATHTFGDTLNFNANRKSWLTKWSAIFG